MARKPIPKELHKVGRIRAPYTRQEEKFLIDLSQKLGFTTPGKYLVACEKIARKKMLKNHVQENDT